MNPHPQLTMVVAQQRIADMHRAADHGRRERTAANDTSSHAVPAPEHAAAAPVRVRRRLVRSCLYGRLEPREDQVGPST